MSELTTEALGEVPAALRLTEIVERKGLGHPDSICDAVVEAASHVLDRIYLDRAGRDFVTRFVPAPASADVKVFAAE